MHIYSIGCVYHSCVHYSNAVSPCLVLKLKKFPQIAKNTSNPFLGELLSQVTERVLQPCLDGNVNLFAHTAKISVNIPVGKSQNFQIQS